VVVHLQAAAGREGPLLPEVRHVCAARLLEAERRQWPGIVGCRAICDTLDLPNRRLHPTKGWRDAFLGGGCFLEAAGLTFTDKARAFSEAAVLPQSLPPSP